MIDRGWDMRWEHDGIGRALSYLHVREDERIPSYCIQPNEEENEYEEERFEPEEEGGWIEERERGGEGEKVEKGLTSTSNAIIANPFNFPVNIMMEKTVITWEEKFS